MSETEIKNTVPTIPQAKELSETSANNVVIKPQFTESQLTTIKNIGSQLSLKRPESFQLIDQDLLKRRSETSKAMLNDLMTNEGSEATKVLDNLLNTINKIDPGQEKKNFLTKWFKKAQDKVTLVKQQYNSVSENIDHLEESLKKRARDHRDDVTRTERRIAEIKETYLSEMLNLEAMDQFLERSKEIRPKLEEKATENNPLGIQQLQRFDGLYRQAEKKRNDIHDTLIALTQDLQVQYILQENVRNIYMGIHDAIFVQLTEFRNLFTDTLATERQIETNRQIQATRKSTTDLRIKRAERLNTATIETHKNMEEGAYNLDALIQSQRSVTQTIRQVRELEHKSDEQRQTKLKELRQAKQEYEDTIRNVSVSTPQVQHQETASDDFGF